MICSSDDGSIKFSSLHFDFFLPTLLSLSPHLKSTIFLVSLSRFVGSSLALDFFMMGLMNLPRLSLSRSSTLGSASIVAGFFYF
ncbi:uncharacterized protein J3R85_004451 [Psidium guajava]|nr:uncharacterized protein J3R85_004451 [Psidium guajava]